MKRPDLVEVRCVGRSLYFLTSRSEYGHIWYLCLNRWGATSGFSHPYYLEKLKPLKELQGVTYLNCDLFEYLVEETPEGKLIKHQWGGFYCATSEWTGIAHKVNLPEDLAVSIETGLLDADIDQSSALSTLGDDVTRSLHKHLSKINGEIWEPGRFWVMGEALIQVGDRLWFCYENSD